MFTLDGPIILIIVAGKAKGGSLDPAFFACGAVVVPVVVRRCNSVAAPLHQF